VSAHPDTYYVFLLSTVKNKKFIF